MRGGWFGPRPEAFNVPFAQQEAQSNTWQRVTALWLRLELSDHHTRIHCTPCLHPGPEVTTQKEDPQLQERNITLGTFCLCWEAHQLCPLYYRPEELGGRFSSHGLSRIWVSSQRAPHIVSSQCSSSHSLTCLWGVVTNILNIPWTQGQCLIHFCFFSV